jgi:hypothetical protein
MAKSSLEKAIEKQQREAKKMADQEARRQRASAIVNGQPQIGGMRIMDQAAEEVFKAVLSCYDGNEKRYVHSNCDVIPEAHQNSLLLEFEKLTMYGVIASPRVWIDAMWEATLTPQGLTYFEDKDRAQQKEEDQVFQIMKNKEHKKEYDVFISHANADKSDYVDELYLVLRKLGVKIFYDTEVLSWGDNWKQVILDGTAKSEFAIIVISENFFDREWTERELEEFLKRQNEGGQKIVLPLLHNISLDMLKEKYPLLGDIQMIDSGRHSKEEITILFAKELIKRLK